MAVDFQAFKILILLQNLRKFVCEKFVIWVSLGGNLLFDLVTLEIRTHPYIFSFFRYFQEGLKSVELFGTCIEDLVKKMDHIRHNQFEEARELQDVKNMLKTSPGFNKMVSKLFKDSIL